MARSLRPRTLAVGFGVYFALIALASWGFAQSLPAAWYLPDITRWVYSTYMVLAAVFLVGLGGLGVSVRRSFARQLRELDRRGAGARRDSGSDSLPPPLPEAPPARDPVDRDIDELLESLSEIEATSVRDAETMERTGMEPYAPGAGVADAVTAAQRTRIVQRQKFLGAFVLGPAVVAAVILGISGMMLPGSDGFAQSYFQLNTALILGIGYSWLGIGGYVAAAVYGLVSGPAERRKR